MTRVNGDSTVASNNGAHQNGMGRTTSGASHASLKMDNSGDIKRWRYISLFCSFLVALSAGSNYGFSAYSPQLQERLHLSSTQINIVGVMGNMGVYLSGPIWGKLVDKNGPRGSLVIGALLVFCGYGGLSVTYEGKIWQTDSLVLLAMLSLSTGLGNCAAFTAAMNAQAKSWHEERRGLCTALVLSGFGLSAFFYSTLSHTLFPGKTGDYLLLLAFGSGLSYVVGFFLVKIYPPRGTSPLDRELNEEEHEAVSERGNGTLHRPASTFSRRRTSSDIGAQAWGHVGHTDAQSADDGNGERLDESHDAQLGERQGLMADANDEAFDRRRPTKDIASIDLTGWPLIKNTDFQILFVIMTLISGTGLLVINNIGTMTRTLYEYNKRHRTTAQALFTTFGFDAEAARKGDVQQLQAHQVSAISVGNAVGRILIGLLSDVVVNRTGNAKDRVYLLLVVCSLALASQVTAAWPGVIKDLKKLLAMSSVTGLMYGTLFGLCPVLMFEWFGLKHFSQNWGIVSLSPVIAGNIFNLLFGSIYDAHVPRKGDVHMCPDGEECFRSVFQITAAGGVVATGLTMLIIRRRAMNVRNESALIT